MGWGGVRVGWGGVGWGLGAGRVGGGVGGVWGWFWGGMGWHVLGSHAAEQWLGNTLAAGISHAEPWEPRPWERDGDAGLTGEVKRQLP